MEYEKYYKNVHTAVGGGQGCLHLIDSYIIDYICQRIFINIFQNGSDISRTLEEILIMVDSYD
jgi:hypothetical protein